MAMANRRRFGFITRAEQIALIAIVVVIGGQAVFLIVVYWWLY